MRNLSLICCTLLLLSSIENAFSQIEKTGIVTEKVKKAACQSRIVDMEATDVQKLVKDSAQLSDSDTYIIRLSKKSLTGTNLVLRNLLSDRDIETNKDDNDSLYFPLDKVFNGVETTTDKIYFQLRDDKFCYEYVFKAIRKKGSNPDPDTPVKPVVIPDFNFVTFVRTQAPCESCEPKTRRIEYDFSSNKLHSIWSSHGSGKVSKTINRKQLFKRFSYGLPWVGKEFAFQVLNVNPFRFDVALEHELIESTTEIPDFFSLIAQVGSQKIVAASTASKTPTVFSRRDSLEAVVIKLKGQLGTKILELRDAGDCYAPCSVVTKVDSAITAYFKEHYKYNPLQEGLDEFLNRELKLDRDPADEKDSIKIADLKVIIKMYRTFKTSGSSTVTYLIPQAQNVDQYLFKLNITPKEGVATGARVLNQEITVDVLGGLKLDVSTGLFFTGMIDEKYSVRADSTLVDTSYTFRKEIVQEKGKYKDFGVSSLVHFYPRLTRDVNLGVHLGAGMTINEKPKLRLLTGFSLLIGRNNRIALSAGWAMGYVDRLSNVYIRGSDNKIFTKNSETSVQIQKVFEKKGYFSLTYSIPIKRKKVEVKAAESGEGDKETGEEKADGEKKTGKE